MAGYLGAYLLPLILVRVRFPSCPVLYKLKLILLAADYVSLMLIIRLNTLAIEAAARARARAIERFP